jgi:alkaline phosphatase D
MPEVLVLTLGYPERESSKGVHMSRMLTRRAMLGQAGLVAASLGLPLDGHGQEPGPVSFAHGVASGDPLQDRVILWTRLTPPADMTQTIKVWWMMALDEEFQQLVARGEALAGAGWDYTVKVDATGLSPGVMYYYRFQSGSATSPVGRTRTLPIGTVDHMRLAFTCCSKYTGGYFHAYRGMAQRNDLDMVLHLGDYFYEDGKAGEIGRPHEPAHTLVTLADYRIRYAQHRSDPDLQSCHANHPWLCIWDDHEVAGDCWQDGAKSHDPAQDGPWALRKAAAMQAYHEWMPIRTVDPNNLAHGFRAAYFGDLVDIIVWETRVFGRDQQASSMFDYKTINDPRRTMMGFTQEAWLLEQLAGSTARWRLYANQTMFAHLHVLNTIANNELLHLPFDLPANPDQWDGYAANRQRLYDWWAALGLRNNIVISGDIHSSWISELTPAPGDPTQYDPFTGRGSYGVEFVTPAATSGAAPELEPFANVARLLNTHIKYVDLTHHGYVLLDITPERCRGEYWYVDPITEPAFREFPATAWESRDATTTAGWNVVRKAVLNG